MEGHPYVELRVTEAVAASDLPPRIDILLPYEAWQFQRSRRLHQTVACGSILLSTLVLSTGAVTDTWCATAWYVFIACMVVVMLGREFAHVNMDPIAAQLFAVQAFLVLLLLHLLTSPLTAWGAEAKAVEQLVIAEMVALPLVTLAAVTLPVKLSHLSIGIGMRYVADLTALALATDMLTPSAEGGVPSADGGVPTHLLAMLEVAACIVSVASFIFLDAQSRQLHQALLGECSRHDATFGTLKGENGVLVEALCAAQDLVAELEATRLDERALTERAAASCSGYCQPGMCSAVTLGVSMASSLNATPEAPHHTFGGVQRGGEGGSSRPAAEAPPPAPSEDEASEAAPPSIDPAMSIHSSMLGSAHAAGFGGSSHPHSPPSDSGNHPPPNAAELIANLEERARRLRLRRLWRRVLLVHVRFPKAIQRLARRRQARERAVAMGTHHRLGETSAVLLLAGQSDLLKMLARRGVRAGHVERVGSMRRHISRFENRAQHFWNLAEL